MNFFVTHSWPADISQHTAKAIVVALLRDIAGWRSWLAPVPSESYAGGSLAAGGANSARRVLIEVPDKEREMW